MKEVYIVKHDIYCYEEGTYESFVEILSDEDSARTYFEIKKEQVMQEYYDYTGVDSFQELEDNYDFYSDLEPTVYGLPYLFVNLEDFGFDKLVVQKKDIMSF